MPDSVQFLLGQGPYAAIAFGHRQVIGREDRVSPTAVRRLTKLVQSGACLLLTEQYRPEAPIKVGDGA